MSRKAIPVRQEHEAREGDGSESQGRTAADRYVGARIRERRIMAGLSQQQLGKLLGITYQQAHKYERGVNRISAGRLFAVAQALNVPVAWFFEGLSMMGEVQPVPPHQRMCLELVRNFALIEDPQQQEALSRMARALAAQSQEAAGKPKGEDEAS
jgi:transcriptional regulator with XRE-family HTH domain